MADLRLSQRKDLCLPVTEADVLKRPNQWEVNTASSNTGKGNLETNRCIANQIVLPTYQKNPTKPNKSKANTALSLEIPTGEHWLDLLVHAEHLRIRSSGK